MVTSPFAPYNMTTAAGSFNTTSSGYVQGMTVDQPAVRYQLAGGVLGAVETLPMWGGVAINEAIPRLSYSTTKPYSALGGIITRATAVPVSPYTASTATGLITGFSVFDQNYSMTNSPANPVPLAYSGQQVNFYRLGSLALIQVACDPGLALLDGDPIYYEVSWDFNLQRLVPYTAATGNVSITSITWASTNGGQGVVVAGAATNVHAVGDLVYISGATNTGTGGNTAVNGPFYVTAFTDNQNFTIAMPAAAGVIGTIAGTIIAVQGGGVLPVKVLNLQTSNCMTVNFNSNTGVGTWNRNDACALIQI